jgi:hypothetical protein
VGLKSCIGMTASATWTCGVSWVVSEGSPVLLVAAVRWIVPTGWRRVLHRIRLVECWRLHY